MKRVFRVISILLGTLLYVQGILAVSEPVLEENSFIFAPKLKRTFGQIEALPADMAVWIYQYDSRRYNTSAWHTPDGLVPLGSTNIEYVYELLDSDDNLIDGTLSSHPDLPSMTLFRPNQPLTIGESYSLKVSQNTLFRGVIESQSRVDVTFDVASPSTLSIPTIPKPTFQTCMQSPTVKAFFSPEEFDPPLSAEYVTTSPLSMTNERKSSLNIEFNYYNLNGDFIGSVENTVNFPANLSDEEDCPRCGNDALASSASTEEDTASCALSQTNGPHNGSGPPLALLILFLLPLTVLLRFRQEQRL